MRNILLFFFIATLSFYSYSAKGQELQIDVVGWHFLDYKASFIPQDILSTQTIVLVKFPEQENHIRGDWKKFATEAQPYIKAIGIDPVMYYYYPDVFAGPDATKAFSVAWKKRDIKNILVLAKVTVGDNVSQADRTVVTVVPFSGDVDIFKNGQEAWQVEESSLDRAFRALLKTIDQNQLKKENLLILDQPEFYDNIQVIRGRRNETFNTDLRIDKLAIPKFSDIAIPKNMPQNPINQHLKQEAEKYNASNVARNSELEQMFTAYPFEHSFVDYTYDEESLRNKGFQYILMRLNTSAIHIRQMLDYEVDDSNKDLITMQQDTTGEAHIESIAPDANAYKYYVKHIYTGDVYLGQPWDASVSWQKALANHLSNLLVQLREKK